jgi:hypothetical protein
METDIGFWNISAATNREHDGLPHADNRIRIAN